MHLNLHLTQCGIAQLIFRFHGLMLATKIYLIRYIYSGATKTIQYVFISVGLAATVIRLAMMSYVLLRKFLLWRSGAKDQGLYPIFFSYFYPGK